jgi:hypothetical protein
VRPKVEAYIGGDYRQMSQRQLHCDNPSRAYVYDESELLHYDGSRGATAWGCRFGKASPRKLHCCLPALRNGATSNVLVG